MRQDVKELMNDYMRRLETANSMVQELKNNPDPTNKTSIPRIETKMSGYRTIILELSRILKKHNEDS